MAKKKVAYIYQVRRTPHTQAEAGHFQVRKIVHGGIVKDEYNLTVRERKVDGEWELWCSCPGFLRQKYPHRLHKHVLLVMDFLSRGSPVYAEYELDPTNKPKFIRELTNGNTPT